MSARPWRSGEMWTVAAALVIGTLGVAVLMILPGLVSALQQGYRFNEAQLGYLSSADLGGLTLGAALGAKLVGRTRIRQGARCGLLIAAVANIVSMYVSEYWPLLILRVLAGLGAGVAVAVCYIVLGQSKHVDRNFSFYLICQLVFGAIALQAMPVLSAAVGVGGLFGLLAGLFAVALLLPRYLPLSYVAAAEDASGTRPSLAARIALAATLAYFVAQGAVWAYLELIGERSGIAGQTVATGLAVSTLAGLSGPMAAAILGPRFGRRIPLLVGLGGSLAALYVLGTSHGSFQFIVAACLFSIAWNFSVPYQLAAIAAADRSGRAIGWAASASLAGLAMGPLAATLVLQGAGYANVLWLSASLCVVSLLGFIPALSTKAGNYVLAAPLSRAPDSPR